MVLFEFMSNFSRVFISFRWKSCHSGSKNRQNERNCISQTLCSHVAKVCKWLLRENLKSLYSLICKVKTYDIFLMVTYFPPTCKINNYVNIQHNEVDVYDLFLLKSSCMSGTQVCPLLFTDNNLKCYCNHWS